MGWASVPYPLGGTSPAGQIGRLSLSCTATDIDARVNAGFKRQSGVDFPAIGLLRIIINHPTVEFPTCQVCSLMSASHVKLYMIEE